MDYSSLDTFLELNNIYPDIDFILLEEIDSTNTYSKKIKLNKPMSLVLANHQTQGKGTKNRTWYSAIGENLLFSIILDKQIAIKNVNFLSILIPIAIIDALKNIGLNAEIKWPNDIYLDSKKLCGILIETELNNEGVERIVIGIGLNINTSYNSLSPEISDISTSLKIYTNKTFNRAYILSLLIFQISKILSNYNNYDNKYWLEKYKDRSLILNKMVLISSNNGTLNEKVTVLDVLEDGSLIVKNLDGTIKIKTSKNSLSFL